MFKKSSSVAFKGEVRTFPRHAAAFRSVSLLKQRRIRGKETKALLKVGWISTSQAYVGVTHIVSPVPGHRGTAVGPINN